MSEITSKTLVCHATEITFSVTLRGKAMYQTLKGRFSFEWITPATRFECIVDITDQGAQRIETEEHRKAVSVSLGTPC